MSERIVDAIARAWWAIDAVGLPPWRSIGEGARVEVRVHAERWLRAIDDAGFVIVERDDGR